MQSIERESKIGKIAIMLAISSTEEEENCLKNEYISLGCLCAVTAIGGEIQNITKKANNSVIGACINNNIISKTAEEIHAVTHAMLEAKYGVLMTVPSGASFVGKIAIVRKGNWIAVAMYGKSAMHFMTNHERIGLGIMHM